MMEVIQGVCIFCTENDSVLSNENKTEFLKIIKINFFSNNRFNFSEFCKLFNKLSICLLCAYKVQCCSNVRDIIKKGDTNKSKRNHNKCCSLCFKTENVTNGTPQLKQEANQFTKDVKKSNNINIKHICLSCSFSVSVWSSILTAIWNLLNDESADSEKENVSKTNARHMHENVDAEKTENKIKTARLRARLSTENGNKSEDSAKINNKSDDGAGSNVGKRRGESTKEEATQDEKNKIPSTRKRSICDSQNDTPKKRRISARVNSQSKFSPEENLKRTRRQNETSGDSTEKSDIDSTPVQSKKSRNMEEISTPKILRPNFRLTLKTNTAKKSKQIASYSNGIDRKLKHLNTVNRETRKKNMYLSYNAVTDQRIMFEIPYILCIPYDKESFITKKNECISSEANKCFKENSLSSEKNINTRKGLKNKGKCTTTSSETTSRETNKRQTRLNNANQKKEIIVIEVSSTDDEASGETTPSYRRSRRIRKPTPKALIESKMEKLSASTKKSTAKNQLKCTVCNQHFPSSYKMKLHKVKHDTSSLSTDVSQNSENMETSEGSDKNTQDNSTETDEESENGEHVSLVDGEENNEESSDQHNTNIDGETDENTDRINENTEETKINVETSIIHEDIEKSDKKLDIDKNVSEEISEAQNIDKDVVVVSTTTDKNDIVEISGKQTSERQPNNDGAINKTDNVEEKRNNEINHKNTNTDAANKTDDNKLTGDKNSNEQSDTEDIILNENSAEQITNDIIEGICEFTNMTNTQESEEISVQDKASEKNANSIELTEENAELIQSNTIVQDTNYSVNELNKKQNEENQEDESNNHEEKNKIQEETLISTKEIISEISTTTSSQDDETIQRSLNVIEIIEDESSQTTTTCSESAIADINDLDPDIVIITANQSVSTNSISVEQSVLTEQNSESLNVSSQGSTVSNISSDNKTEIETTVTEECSQKSNGVISIENNSRRKEIVEDFAMMEDLLENMGA